MVWYPNWLLKRRLKPKVEEAYIKLRNVCEPGTLNPKAPGNPTFMKADARDYINPLRPALSKAKLYPPDTCTADDESLVTWFKYFETLRVEL